MKAAVIAIGIIVSLACDVASAINQMLAAGCSGEGIVFCAPL